MIEIYKRRCSPEKISCFYKAIDGAIHEVVNA